MRRSSLHIALVLLGSVSNVGCSDDPMQRNIYRTRADCQTENPGHSCEEGPQPAGSTSAGHGGGGVAPFIYYGPWMAGRTGSGAAPATGFSSAPATTSSRAMGSQTAPSSVVRGGFGSSASSFGGASA